MCAEGCVPSQHVMSERTTCNVHIQHVMTPRYLEHPLSLLLVVPETATRPSAESAARQNTEDPNPLNRIQRKGVSGVSVTQQDRQCTQKQGNKEMRW